MIYIHCVGGMGMDMKFQIATCVDYVWIVMSCSSGSDLARKGIMTCCFLQGVDGS